MRNDVVVQMASRASALCEAPIRVHGLAPQTDVRLEMTTTDRDGLRWRSYGLFRADAGGTVELAAVAPLEGTYSGVDAMGLFWSVRPADHDAPFFAEDGRQRTWRLAAVVDGTVVGRAKQVRRALPAGAERIALDSGDVRGAFYRHRGAARRPAVLVLGGSEGGVPDDFAAAFAGLGYAALGLAYFRADGCGSELVEVPVERVLHGIDFLASQPTVDPRRIALFGRSKGGELALLAAAQGPRLAAVASLVGSGICWFGLHFTGADAGSRSSWTLGGRAVPFVPAVSSASQEIGRAFAAGDPLRYRLVYDASRAVFAGRIDAATIPVERIPVPLLLLSAGDDEMWPSRELAECVIERRTAAGCRDDVHECFSSAGHAIGLPHQPTHGWNCIDTGHSKIAFGGSVAAYARANRVAWRALTAYLDRRFAAAAAS